MSWSTLVDGLVKQHVAAEADALEDILSRYGDDLDNMTLECTTKELEDGESKTTDVYWNKIKVASVVVLKLGARWQVVKTEFDLTKWGSSDTV